MNKTNIWHGIYALLMFIPFFYVNEVMAGITSITFWFISREHAHRQVDIKTETGISVTAQNPFHGFLGWSDDAYRDVYYPIIALELGLIGLSYGY